MSIPSTTNNWQDTIGTYYLSGNYHSAPYYLFRVEFRTNNSSAGNPGGFAISVISTNSDPNDLAIASYSVATNGVTTSYSDIFVKTNYGWPRMTLTRLCSPDTRSITYYNSYEGAGASSRTEAYTGINGSGTGYASSELHSLSSYTSLIYGQLTANVKYANSAGSVAWGNVTGKPSTYTPADHTHSYLPLAGGTLTGTLGFKSNYLVKPVAEFRTQSDRFTGAITIALPAGISNTMVSMWIDVYNYSTNTSFSVHVGGYTYNNQTWQHNPFAMVYGANHTVRLGHNGTNFVIYIGETNSTWSYPQISVRNVILGYAPAYDNWKKDWGISFVTSFSNVSAVINNYAWTTKNFSMSFSNGVLTITYS